MRRRPTLLFTPAIIFVTTVASIFSTGCYAQSTPIARQPQRNTGPFEHASMQQAWQASQESQVPVLLFVTSDHCYYCKKMVAETYANPDLSPVFARLFETASLKQADNPQLVEQLGVRMFPTTLVISPAGKLLGRLEGHVPPRAIGERLNPILVEYRKTLAQTARPKTQQIASGRTENR